MRSVTVPDTDIYVEFYNQIDPGNIVSFALYSFEPGFQLLGHIVKLFFGNSAILFLAVVVVINIVLILLSIRKIAFRLSLSSCSINFISAIVLYFAYFGLFYNAIAAGRVAERMPRFVLYNSLDAWGIGRELPEFAKETFNEMWKKGLKAD